MPTTDRTVIEDHVEIKADAQRVWQLVSEPGWWINEGEYREHSITEREGLVLVTDERWGTFPLSVEHSDPPRYIAYRWYESTESPRPDAPSTLTEFWIEDHESGGVTLRVRESGFETLGKDAEALRSHIADNTAGWAEELRVAARHCAS
ncbi:ATPase [Aeromicrobium sp. CTD01-1L150]|uniref:ATPase n=1 Tax=Aeromicrobium sp. CTD01-1L150 TaxID=3341830 RepID=UPI0035C22017